MAAPSTEITMQDLSDTLRYMEHQGTNMVFDKVLDSAGKENLGGGVTVGITLTLLNARLAFEMRPDPIETGAATVSDTGMTLTDTGATFFTNNVAPGDTVMNYDDQSVGTVLSVISETELVHSQLDGGTENDWDIGEGYAIYQTVQCNVSGGNLVAVDSVGADMEPIFPTSFTQVVRTSSSSATLQELTTIQYSAYGGGVTVDTTSPYSGTTFPVGTPQQPVNNCADALTIATERGFLALFVIGDITLASGLDFSGISILGESVNKSTITIPAGANVLESEFYEATITGTLDGNSVLRRCRLSNLDYVSGEVERCILEPGVIQISGLDAIFLDCWCGVQTLPDSPIIDMGGSGSDLIIRNYNGCIRLRNKTGPESVSIDLNSGYLILDATVTNGSILVRGIGGLDDKSTGSAVVMANELLKGEAAFADAVLEEALADHANVSGSLAEAIHFGFQKEGGRWKIDTALNQLVFYEDDNVTELARFDLKDAAGDPASDDVYERVRV